MLVDGRSNAKSDPISSGLEPATAKAFLVAKVFNFIIIGIYLILLFIRFISVHMAQTSQVINEIGFAQNRGEFHSDNSEDIEP